MNHAPNQKLRINRADQDAAAQSGFPPLFYAIKRKFGDRIANIYLRHYEAAQQRHQLKGSIMFLSTGTRIYNLHHFAQFEVGPVSKQGDLPRPGRITPTVSDTKPYAGILSRPGDTPTTSDTQTLYRMH